MLLRLKNIQGETVYLNPDRVSHFKFYTSDDQVHRNVVRIIFPDETYLTLVDVTSYNTIQAYCDSQVIESII